MATAKYVNGMDVSGAPIRFNDLPSAPPGTPVAQVVIDSDGNLYRATADGEAN